MDHEDTLHTITAMRRQEEVEYYSCDYFRQNSEEVQALRHAAELETGKPPCDPGCRQVMFYWMCRVIDFFPQMSRETVAFAMSYLDRFLQTKEGQKALVLRKEFQLAAITCLYTSVKIHEYSAVSPRFLEQLSQDEYSVRDLEKMEIRILQALKWRLASPTAVSFLRHYLSLIPLPMLDEQDRKGVFNLAKFQTEVSLGEYHYVTVNASTIAYCALLNAVEALQIDSSSIAWFVAEAAHLDFASKYNEEIQTSLEHDYLNHSVLEGGGSIPSGNSSNSRDKKEKQRASCHRASPRSVACKSSA